MSLEVALLHRLVTSPFTRRRFWDERPVLALVAGDEAWVIRDRGVFPATDGAAPSATADAVISVETPSTLHAVGQVYVDFRQTTDEEVVTALGGDP